ncbi:MAG: VOC family protein [Porphyrobacter sp.]|nr:VOC family protein [Porphyrobacter sp.]
MSGPCNVAHFSIACDDVERAKGFYETVFGWRIEPWGPPNYYQVFTGTAEAPGILGDLRQRHEPLAGGGSRGYECTIGVPVLAETIAAIERAGGRIVLQPYRIENVGDLAYFEDTEGNRAGIIQYAANLSVAAEQRL